MTRVCLRCSLPATASPRPPPATLRPDLTQERCRVGCHGGVGTPRIWRRRRSRWSWESCRIASRDQRRESDAGAWDGRFEEGFGQTFGRGRLGGGGLCDARGAMVPRVGSRPWPEDRDEYDGGSQRVERPAEAEELPSMW